MKRVLLLAVVLVGAASVAQASPLINTGDVIKVVSQESTIDGGPFGVDGPDVNSAADFMSFCIEMNEAVVVSSVNTVVTYFVKIATAAEDGGFAGGNPDPLSAQAAFLYSRYVAGLLDDVTSNAYNDTNIATRQVSLDGLQLALWILEQEAVFVNSAYRRNNGNANGTPIGNAAVWNMANTLVAAANSNAVANNFYGVKVMQLWKTALLDLDPANSNAAPDTNVQDMLITVPEGGSTFAVLMFGIGAVTASRFRFRRTV
jgi:hypothetical protein